MNAMLSEALQDFTGLLKQLLTNLLGNDADVWGNEFRKFLRKETCWVKGDGSKSATSTEPKLEPQSLPMSVTIYADLDPCIPSGFYLAGEGTEHRRMGRVTLEKREDGKLYVNGVEATLYLSPDQQDGKTIQGHKLRKELKDKKVLNARILDALRVNQQLIPEDWKQDEQGRTRYYIFFWGTVFRHSFGDLCVEYLYWHDGGLDWDFGWLDRDWDDPRPAASLAS